ncbi:recombinase family protein [Escherichia coli]|uniref:recombinase family protein n=1 Tax=Escherichia coli TaxID=562 RepID=UPI000B7CD895|nr:recombinase family protein [Escherichia coli]EHG6171195.1 recombinase family protein [Escherichia fergusonii]EEX1849199.1 hypothetical protein [Escherichia coli]EEX1849571.1 hypothetical protein [Escherichia coli]EFC5324187.1 recombinase family protein [Escherichia coli]EFD9708914.1 recombinase family protein [Escherichia coli]
MLIGYARVSKADGSQSLDLQHDALRAAGVERDNIDDDVLKNLLNGWFMHIAIHAKNLKELADKKGQFIAIYRGFLLSLKDK